MTAGGLPSRVFLWVSLVSQMNGAKLEGLKGQQERTRRTLGLHQESESPENGGRVGRAPANTKSRKTEIEARKDNKGHFPESQSTVVSVSLVEQFCRSAGVTKEWMGQKSNPKSCRNLVN